MLFNKELIDRFYSTLSPPELEEFKYRCSGRSTALALQYLSEAIQNPKTWIPIKDHFGTIQADLHLLSMIKDIVDRLGLEYIKFNRTHCKICFDWVHPFKEFEEKKGA